MALLDVAWVVSDPMFASTFTARRRAETVDNKGRSAITETPLGTLAGTVVPQDTRIAREDAATQQPRTLDIYCRSELRGSAQGFSPDIVTWRGDDYEVVSCVSYRDFGVGFYKATATMVPPQGTPIP